MDVLGHAQPQAGMPASTVEDEHDLFGRTGADLACEGGQLSLKELDRYRGGEMEDGAPGGGMDEADEVAPREAVLDRREGTLAVAAPHLMQDRLEANAVLVDRPQLDRRLRKGSRDCTEQWAQTGYEVGLCHWVGLHVARAWLQPTRAEPPQGAPARLPADPAPKALADPGRHSAPAPAVARGMRPGERLAQRSLLLLWQQEAALPSPVAPVAHAVAGSRAWR